MTTSQTSARAAVEGIARFLTSNPIGATGLEREALAALDADRDAAIERGITALAQPSATARAVQARHAACGRFQCEECGDDFDECTATYSAARDQQECADCHEAAEQAAADDAEYRSYAYH